MCDCESDDDAGEELIYFPPPFCPQINHGPKTRRQRVHLEAIPSGHSQAQTRAKTADDHLCPGSKQYEKQDFNESSEALRLYLIHGCYIIYD